MRAIAIPVHNVHQRKISADLDTVGKLIDSLGGPDDLLWPASDWLPLHIDGPMELGTEAGHGPARYHIVGYQPGRWIRFELFSPAYMVGFHEFSAHPAGRGLTILQHLLALRLTPAGWPIYPTFFRVLHDTVAELALDRAELATTGYVADPVRPRTAFKIQKALIKPCLRLMNGG